MPRWNCGILLGTICLLIGACGPSRVPVKGIQDPSPVFAFAVIGDTHTIGTPVTGKAVYTRIIEQINEIQPDLVVHVGDMIVAPGFFHRDRGQTSVDTFMTYTRKLDSAIEFYPVLGNHEGEIDGFRLAIDTFPQFQGRGWYSFDRQGVHFVLVENNTDTADSTRKGYSYCKPNGGLNTPGSRQRRWLDNDLRLRPPNTRWTFGFGHRAYYGAEGRRFRPNIALARTGPDSFCNLIESAGVDVFFNGDQHCYTRTAPIRAGKVALPGERGTIYITCGGGGGKIHRGRPFPGLSDLPDGAYQAGTDSLHFFLLCRVWDDIFRAEVIDTSGVVFDRWEIRKAQE
ncbi:MAG: metallophosphoesterase [Candidatus Eisenbacteria sp.]|nr:metallophosphoesterase [Candidatus Eisenbacteria bacterium]